MRMQWIDNEQYMCFSISELFHYQDLLDSIENTPEKAWILFDEFLDEAESLLEYSEEFIRELEELEKTDKNDYIRVERLDDII